MISKNKFRIIFKNKSLIWNHQEPLQLGQNYVLEFRNESIFIHDFSIMDGIKNKLKTISTSNIPNSSIISLNQELSFKLQFIQVPEKVSLQKISEIKNETPILVDPIPKEDQFYIQGYKSITSMALVLSLFIFLIHFNDETKSKNEEIIPQKFAHIILKKEPSQSPAKSSNQAKAMNRIFQSKTIQKSLSSILKGGISKYSILNTGRNIQSLNEKIQKQSQYADRAIEGKTQSLINEMSQDQSQLGTKFGYGSNSNINIKGQGKGTLEIGLNFHDASVDQGLTKEEVAKVIHSHMSEIRFCYESAIMSEPSLAGKILMDFNINSNGLIQSSAPSQNTMNNDQVPKCLSNKMKSWKFPNPRGGVQVAVSYPFIFKSLTR